MDILVLILVWFVFYYGKEAAEEIVIMIFGLHKSNAIKFKIHNDLFMDNI